MSDLANSNLIMGSTLFGTQLLTIANNVATGTTQACKSVLVLTDGSDVNMAVQSSGAADVNDFLLPEKQAIPIPVDDVSKLTFYGATDGKKIYILWRG